MLIILFLCACILIYVGLTVAHQHIYRERLPPGIISYEEYLARQERLRDAIARVDALSADLEARTQASQAEIARLRGQRQP